MSSQRTGNDERFATRSEVENMFNEYRDRIEEFKANIVKIVVRLRAEVMANEPPVKRRRIMSPQTVPAPPPRPTTPPTPLPRKIPASLLTSPPRPTTPLFATPPRQTSPKAGAVPAMIVVTPPAARKGEISPPPYPRTMSADLQNKFLTVPNIRAKRKLVYD